jgi:uncharacterized membrane protein
MIEFENNITIIGSIQDVFDSAADLTNVPKWNYYVRSVVSTSARPRTEGAAYHQVRRKDEQDLRIIRLEPNRSLVVETISPSKPELRRVMIFVDDGGSTRITDRWELDLGVPRLLEGLAANRARRGVRENLGKLKVLLETGRVTLQDGRTLTV